MPARRFAGDLPERAIERRQRFEAHIERYLTDPQVWVLRKITRLLDPRAGDAFDEGIFNMSGSCKRSGGPVLRVNARS